MSEIKKPPGRPRVDATPVTVRIPPDLLKPLDRWAAEDMPGASRPEVIRAALRDWLIHLGRMKPDPQP